jgi:hypothetical protein
MSGMYWDPSGTRWTWPFDPPVNCADIKLPVPIADIRKPRPETADEKKAREEAERRAKRIDKNKARIEAIHAGSPDAVESLALCFTDSKIEDDGTIEGRVHAILDATEHGVVPGLQTGVEFGQKGFKPEFHDPWPSSSNQVGHFLTAVRLAFDPAFLDDVIMMALLGSWLDTDVPLRLIIGHEKVADPEFWEMFSRFREQYEATTDEDIKNFKAGKLDKIKVGTGKGNSMADLLLSEKGWILGRSIVEKKFKSKKEVADWIRTTLKASKTK